MTWHPAFGAIFFLAAAAGSSGDWALTIEGQPRICAVDEYTCQNALAGIKGGLLRWATPGTPMRCDPFPGCRDPRELCIEGFNCP